MPYPMAPALPLREFIERVVRDHGAELRETEAEVMGPKGPFKVRYLIRAENRVAPLLDLADDQMLTPNVIRSLCVQLDISPAHFGLHLG